MFSEIFQLKCTGCGQVCESGMPVCPDCLSKLITYEHRCKNCGYPTAVPAAVCGQCLSKPLWDNIFINYRYTGTLKKLLREIKFGYRITGAKSVTRLIDSSVLKKYDIITPVPSHFTRKFRRFAHPAVTMAKFIANSTDSSYSQLLDRIRKTEYQYKLNRHMRSRNVKGAFSCESDLTGLKILLVDDIITTGSTVKECCRILRACGADMIDVYVLSGGAVR